MYQGERVRIHSGMNAAAMTAAAMSGGSRSAAASMGASESAEPWCFSRSRESWWTNATSGRRTAKAIQSDRVGSSEGSIAASVATVAQTTANSNAAAGALNPVEFLAAAGSTCIGVRGSPPDRNPSNE